VRDLIKENRWIGCVSLSTTRWQQRYSARFHAHKKKKKKNFGILVKR